jgi:hypothetical protein
MGIVIGPVLRRADGYIFDTWTASKGVILGYPYRRIEDAHYARKAEIKASAQGHAPSAIVCQTLDEFITKSTGYEMPAAGIVKLMKSVRPPVGVSPKLGQDGGGALSASRL